MGHIQTINAERIAWCCAYHSITPDNLARAINVSPAALTKVMAGEAGLSFKQLRKLAGFFGRGTLFFLEPGQINEAKVHSPQFRTLANRKPELSHGLKLLIERVEQQRTIFLALREELDPEEVTHFLPPALNGLSIPKAAKMVRRWLELADKNNFTSYRQAIEARGLLVFCSSGYNGKWQIAKHSPILGFSLYDPVCPVILVKKQDSDTRQTFTLMHELGHLLLHKMSWIDDADDMYSSEDQEQEANAFAGHLLVPDRFLLDINDRERPAKASEFDDWLKPQRKAWGVSGEVILRRLMDVSRLDSSEYGTYRHWSQTRSLSKSGSGSRAYRHREPNHMFGESYVRTVLDALNSRHITLTKASAYLDSLTIKDLHKLEQFYADV